MNSAENAVAGQPESVPTLAEPASSEQAFANILNGAAGVAELADARDSKSRAPSAGHVGSTPTSSTTPPGSFQDAGFQQVQFSASLD